uniref:Uncharacterized protein n=1 Tax=Romanomermis culicivorax TaxID=13658 RepID=A0A915IP20_ROMCU
MKEKKYEKNVMMNEGKGKGDGSKNSATAEARAKRAGNFVYNFTGTRQEQFSEFGASLLIQD